MNRPIAFLPLAVAFVLLAACATQAPSQAYRPRGETQSWDIGGDMNKATRTVTININGQPAVQGKLTWLDLSGDFKGNYRGHAVSTSCHNVEKWLSSYLRCDVFVDNERAASLTF